MTPDQRCGNCRYWGEPSTVPSLHLCMALIPDCALRNDGDGNHTFEQEDRFPMGADEGEDCPCHEPKEPTS